MRDLFRPRAFCRFTIFVAALLGLFPLLGVDPLRAEEAAGILPPLEDEVRSTPWPFEAANENPAAELISGESPRSLQVLPSGLIYRSYLAGQKEPRFASMWVHERESNWIWDVAIGGRVGLLRYGTHDPCSPEGFQIDLEGAAFPRLDMEHKEDVVATDFRMGMPLSFGNRRFQTKFAVYHLSSHLGDEYMVRYQTFDRINYSRNVLVWGNSFYCTDDLRLYAEAGWAFYAVGGSEPWEFQFGAEYAPALPTGPRPAPFLAINTHLREEVDFGGNLVLQTGLAWRGSGGGLFRAGMQYYSGKSDQYEFYDRFEDKLGLGIWYDY